MKRINGSNETHDHESLPLSRGRWIVIGRSRWSHVAAHYKTPWNACHWIAIGRIRCVIRDFISTIINPCDRRLRLNVIRWTLISPRILINLSEDRRPRSHAQSDAPHAAMSPPHHDRWLRSDRTALIALRHLRA